MKILVTGSAYDGGNINRTYEGDDLKQILREISDNHSYGQFDDDEEYEELTVKEIIKDISERNGDGCDYINVSAVEGKVKKII